MVLVLSRPEALGLCFATSLFARGQLCDCLGYTQVDNSQDHGLIQITLCDVHLSQDSVTG
jgi:hypothetical protein